MNTFGVISIKEWINILGEIGEVIDVEDEKQQSKDIPLRDTRDDW